MDKKGLRLGAFVRYIDNENSQYDGIIIGFHFVGNKYYYVVELDKPKKVVLVEHLKDTEINATLFEIDVITEFDDMLEVMRQNGDTLHNERCVKAFLQAEGETVG